MKLTIFSLWVCSVVVHTFDPTKVDYCKQPCKDGQGREVEHTACGYCKLEKGHTEVVEEIQNFREQMVKDHNKYRNEIARGDKLTLFDFPTAADMKAVSYDLEMEYIARCLARRFVDTHDKCRKPNGYMGAGQNIFFSTVKELNADPVTPWYKEILNVSALIAPKELIAKYKFNPSYGHFTQVVWAKVSIIGCARVWIEGASFPFVLICNYADKESVGNMEGAVLYKVGNPCSDCPDKCNKDYPALCGEVTIPTDKPYDMGTEPLNNGTSEDDKYQPTEIIHNPNYTRGSDYVTSTNRKDDFSDYGEDGLDVPDAPRNRAVASITSNMTFLSFVTMVVLWLK